MLLHICMCKLIPYYYIIPPFLLKYNAFKIDCKISSSGRTPLAKPTVITERAIITRNARQELNAFSTVFSPTPSGHYLRAYLFKAAVPVTSVLWLRL